MLPIKNILVPIDFSAHSKYAAKYAKELAVPIKAALHLIHVLEPINTYGTWEGLPLTDLMDRAISESQQKLQSMALEFQNAGCQVHIKVLEGHPDSAINEYATTNGIDLISMGTHGRRGLEYILFGSTTEKVLRTAPCSVLAVRMPNVEQDVTH